MTARTLNDHALILHSHPVRETDRILHLFTRRHGRLRALIRNIRSSRRRYASPATTAELCDLTLWIPKDHHADAKVLRIAPLLPPGPSPTSVGQLLAVHYVLSLLDETLPPADPHPDLFEDILRLLPALRQTEPTTRRSLLRSFEIRLLKSLGIAPSAQTCEHCGQPLDSTDTTASDHGFLCSACSHPSIPRLHPHFLAFYNASLDSLTTTPIPDDLDRQAVGLLQLRLRTYLGRTPRIFGLRQQASA